MSNDVPIPVPEEHSEGWASSAHAARVCFHMLTHLGPPHPGSNFASILELPQRVDVSTKSYIRAGVDHLHLWADYVAPFKFHPDQQTRIDLRPALTLARAAMECAAHALWIFGTNDVLECVRRHVVLLRWDLEERRKSRVDSEHKLLVREKDDELVAAVSEVFDESQVRPLNGYLELFQKVCASDEYNFELSEVEPMWRAASGAAHGKSWISEELQVRQKYAVVDGKSIDVLVADVVGIQRALEMANSMVTSATLKQILWSGYDPMELMKNAYAWIGQNMTYREGVEPEVMERMKRGERPR